MTPQEALEKANKVLAMAASTNEEEARTSSRILTKLIRKYGLVLSLPGTARPTPAADPPEPTGPAGSAAPGTAPPRTARRGRATKSAQPPAGRFYATAPRDGTCDLCRRAYPAGATVLVGEGGFSMGATHVHCDGGAS